MQTSGRYKSVSAEDHGMGIRPLCFCCHGGEHRKGYRYTKAKSRKMTRKARRSKPKHKEHRV